MSTERMNNTDTFYTLTGKSGEIFNGDKVRISLIFTPRKEVSAEPVPTESLSVFGPMEVTRNFLPYSLFAKALPYEGRSREQHQEGSGRRGGLWRQGYKMLGFAVV